MSWLTHISISPPWSARPDRVLKGNAQGNAPSTECSPLATSACGCRAHDVGHLPGSEDGCNRGPHRDLPLVRTGGDLCRPSPRESATTGVATQRGRERPPSGARQVPCRLTPEGRSRPRSARVPVVAVRPVMPSAHRPVMTPALTPPIGAPCARFACGTETSLRQAKEPLCL